MKHTLATLLAVLVVALLALSAVVAQQGDQTEVQLKAAINKEVVEGNLKAAIELYRKIAQSGNRPVAAKALIRMGQCYEKLGDAEASKAYQRVVSDFADQKEAVAEAQALLAAGSRDRRPASGVSEQQVWVLDENPRPVPRPPSSDSRYIPYTDVAGQRLKLHDLVTGENRVILERETGLCFGVPVISPDGTQITYARFRRPPLAGTDFELRVANIDGSGSRVLATRKENGVIPLAWLPDGRNLLARTGNSAAGVSLALVPAGGGPPRALTTGGEDSNGCLSPEGKYLVTYPVGSRAGRAPGGLKLRPIDGSTALPLFDSPARNWAPIWAPDGRHILFLSDRTGKTDLWSLRMSGARPEGEPELVRSNVELMTPLGFTRDGSFYYQLGHPYQQDVFVADMDPATGRALSKPERINQRAVGQSGLGVAWSPDGRFIAYTNESGGATTSIVLRSDRTGEEREIVPVPPLQRHSIVNLDWFPDGRALLAQVQDSNGHRLLLQVDVQTGQSTVLLDRGTGESVSQPDLLRGGKTLVYVQSADLTYKDPAPPALLMRRNLDTGETKELHRSAGYVEKPSLSPDGRKVLFQGNYPDLNTMSLLIISADGGAIRELYRSKEWMSDQIWSSDGRRVLFSPVSKSDRQPLLSIPIEGGEPQPTGLSLPIMYTMALRPDGRRIALISGEGAPDEVWVIRNLLSGSKARK